MSTRNPPRAPGVEPEQPDPGFEQGPQDELEEDRDAILARRALFIASALTGISLAVGCEGLGTPRPCLSATVVEDAGPPPMPCLSQLPEPLVPPDTVDAGAGPADGGAGDAGAAALDASAPDASTRPRVREPTPRPCLTIAAPNPPPPPPSVKK